MKIPDEAVEYVFNAYRANLAWEGTEAERLGRFRVALEASGAVFLTDEEREAVLLALDDFMPGSLTVNAIQSAREKLA